MAGLQQYLLNHIFTWSVAVQLAVGGVVFLLAHNAAVAVYLWFERNMALSGLCDESDLQKIRTFLTIDRPLVSVLLLGIAFRIARRFAWPSECLELLLMLSFGLFLTRFLATPVKNRYWAGIITAAIWVWVTLVVFHFLDFWINFLNSIDFAVGGVHVSILTLARAFFLSLVLYWLSKNLLIIFRIWLQTGSRLPPATQTLLNKLCAIFLLFTSTGLILHYLKIDLTLFALFSGALALGIGISLQKIFSNLLSGFMILADRSIKPGDVIQVGSTYGCINFLGSLYVSVVTRSGIEHLIPNENLITGEVINWSFSNNLVRLQLPVGVSYDSDLEAAMKLMLDATMDSTRVLREPNPSCIVTSFGDNAINLELRAWINDPQNGLAVVRSELFIGIWRRFKENGIEMPYPQRVLHHKSIPDIRVRGGAFDSNP
jgi:small-conductance mechanosensitive channel